MNPQDDEPRKPAALLVPPPLDSIGIGELRLYIETLRTEIGRVEAIILARDTHRAAAASFFKLPPERGGGA